MPAFEPDTNESRGRRDYVVTMGFVLLAGLLLVLPMEAQQQVSSAVRGSVFTPFIWLQDTIHEARMRGGEVSDLRSQLDSTMALLSFQRSLPEENQRLRALLDLRERGSPEFRAASAIRSGTRGSESMFLLDVGADDGVSINDPVVVTEGLVGVVREVGAQTSLAMDWTHPDFRVSVMTLDGAAFGIVEPHLGAFREEARLLLNGVPYHTLIDDGIPVVTSGEGTLYPRGILVGTVVGLAEIEAGWHRSYWLDPAVHPGGATHVLVLVGEEGLGTDPLEELWLPTSEGGPNGEGGADGVAGPDGEGGPAGGTPPAGGDEGAVGPEEDAGEATPPSDPADADSVEARETGAAAELGDSVPPGPGP